MRQRLGGLSPVEDREKRKEVRAEIDAAAFHAYGFNKSEVEYVLEDFNQVENPRLMDDEYFSIVLDKFKTL